MRKWLKRLLLAAALLLCIALVLSAVGVTLFRGTPDWYHPRSATAQERAAAAERAERQLQLTHNWAAKVKAEEDKRLYASRTGTTLPATAATEPLTISFTDQELCAFFDKWSAAYDWESKYSAYLDDPAIVLREGRLILAGRMKKLGTVASIQFQPALDEQGLLHLELLRVTGGYLPLPDKFWRPHRDRILKTLRRQLPSWQQSARIDPSGATNNAAMFASLSRLFIDSINHQPAEPILFLPLLDQSKSVPVRLTAVEITDGRLTLTVQPLDPAQRSALLQRIRSSYGTATALRD